MANWHQLPLPLLLLGAVIPVPPVGLLGVANAATATNDWVGNSPLPTGPCSSASELFARPGCTQVGRRLFCCEGPPPAWWVAWQRLAAQLAGGE